jgi:hypothetical protein
MIAATPITLEHWGVGVAGAIALAATVALCARRPPLVPRTTMWLGIIGAGLLLLAASGIAWTKPAARPVAVMVDLSPSTRGAAYRDRATLTRRIDELLGDKPHDVYFFSMAAAELVDAGVTTLPDLPATFTHLPELDVPAVVLFSDGRFRPPGAMPPAFCVIDPNLENVNDAAVISLDTRADVAVGVRNTGDAARPIVLQGVDGERTTAIRPGAFTIERKPLPNVDAISATFAPGDLWPENDAMSVPRPPPAVAQRWWVGNSSPPDQSWRQVPPANLPADSAQFLGASLVVLDNVPADALDDSRRAAIEHYVKDLGGGLLILGGDRAFAAGGYGGTSLDAISPLSTTPPEPTTHWILLADASGSMNQDAGGGRTRWAYAADAVVSAATQLPPADVLSVGSFAANVRWWSSSKSVADTTALPLPPADAHPGGPTNLDAALRAVATANADLKLPTQLFVATDAQASIERPGELAETFKSRQIHLHVLLTGDTTGAKALADLKSIGAATGGSARSEALPADWSKGLKELARAAQDVHLHRDPIRVSFLEPRVDVTAAVWNRTWLKSNASALAHAEKESSKIAVAARWNVGEGRVAAVAFGSPPGEVVAAVAKLVERPPRDPRFKVMWDVGSTVRVSIDAIDGKRYLNGEVFTVEWASATVQPTIDPIPQIAPGRYEFAFDAPQAGAVARVRHGSDVIDQFPLPARYAPEFDAVGNDRSALAELGRKTGGAVIEPGVTRRLDIPWPRRAVPLVSWLGTIGAAFVAAALVRWRIGS